MPDCPNPFRPGAGLDPPYLAGRERELDMFAGVLEDNRVGNAKNVMLYGLRGVGKTVLLGKFASMCRDKKFLPIARHVYGPDDSDPVQFASGLKHALRTSIESSSGMESAKGKLRKAGKYLKPSTVGVSGLVYEPSYDRDMKEPLTDHLVDYFARNWKIVKDIGYVGAVLLLDEFHTVDDVKGKWHTLGNFLAAVNEVQRQGCGYSLVLSGLPVLTKNVKRGRSYTERMFKLTEVSGLADSDAKMAILRPLETVDRKFSPGLVSAVVKDTGGYPYFIQFFCCEILRRIPKNTVSLRDYKSIREDIMCNIYNDFFDQRMADLIPSEKNTLYLMSAISDANLRFSSILAATDSSRGTVSTHLKRLEEKGVVYRHDYGLYKFALPLLRPYLETKRPPTMSRHGRVSGTA